MMHGQKNIKKIVKRNIFLSSTGDEYDWLYV